MNKDNGEAGAQHRKKLMLEGREDTRAVRECLQGKIEAFEFLVKKYQDPVYYIAYRMVSNQEEAKDLAQETFVKAFEKLDTFNMKMPFRSWLYKICSNLTIDNLRGRKGREISVRIANDARETEGGRNMHLAEFVAPEREIPENVSLSNDISRYVQEALDGLPENYRLVMVLHHMEGLNYAEIGKVLGVPRNTVKTWAHRARGELCGSLKGVV
ncbi:MAG: sigma-70 family RNA polymerase sigma factor [Actinobacteria bacterium]|nr:sigma-70 family RNA polymerase sigma factor [Actinomycetota bacterium]